MASWRCQSRLFQGQFGKTQFGDLEGGPGLVGTAGGWEGERERWEEGLTKSSQQAEPWLHLRRGQVGD